MATKNQKVVLIVAAVVAIVEVVLIGRGVRQGDAEVHGGFQDLHGQMKRQSNPVYNKKTKKTTYTTEYGKVQAWPAPL